MTASLPQVIALREVRHFGPDDCLHYESLSVRTALHAHTIPTHRHESVHQFQLIDSGACTLTLDGQQHRLETPCLLQLPPGAVHGFAYEPRCSGRQVTVPSIELRKAFANNAAVLTTLDQALILEARSVGTAFDLAARLFDELRQEFEGRLPVRQESLMLLSAQLAIWCHRHGSDEARSVTRDVARDTLLQRFLALVEQHFVERRTLAAYAQQLEVTADHLSRVCRAIKGMSALELLHERQYLEARRLLAYTDLRIGDVALALGFEDSGYFSRFFTRHAGMSPAAYRQHHAPVSASNP